MNPENPTNPNLPGRPEPRGFWRSRNVGNIVLLCVLLPLLYLFWARGMSFFLVPSGSMEDTLLPGDYLVTLTEPEYHRGDIIVLRDPQDPKKAQLVKRLIGLPGDTIAVRGGALYLNGEYTSEPYIREPMGYQIDEPVTVPPGEMFVLGDNRNKSDDSHIKLETYPLDYILGRVGYIYLPLSRMGALPRHDLETTPLN